jgi:repressor LexA
MNCNIKEARQAAGLSQKALSAQLGISPATLSGYESGAHDPKPETLMLIARACGVTVDALLGARAEDAPLSLSDEALRLARDFSALNPWGRRAVRSLVDNELQRMGEAPETAADWDALVVLRISDLPASAGTGVYLGPESFHEVYVNPLMLPRGAAYGVPVRGDSMEPRYHNGDILVVSKDEPRVGEIGVFTLDNEGYVKQRGDGQLLSLNPKYAPIPMDESIRCNGKVIGVLKLEQVFSR